QAQRPVEDRRAADQRDEVHERDTARECVRAGGAREDGEDEVPRDPARTQDALAVVVDEAFALCEVPRIPEMDPGVVELAVAEPVVLDADSNQEKGHPDRRRREARVVESAAGAAPRLVAECGYDGVDDTN